MVIVGGVIRKEIELFFTQESIGFMNSFGIFSTY